MNKKQFIEELTQDRPVNEILPLLTDIQREIYEMLQQHRTYKEIENSLHVFPADIALIRRYLFKEMPIDNSNTSLNSNENKTSESENTTLLDNAIILPKVELAPPPEQKEEISLEPLQKNEPEIENMPPLKEPEKRKRYGVMKIVKRYTGR